MLEPNRKGSCDWGSFSRKNMKDSLKFNEKRKVKIQRKRGKAHSGVGPQVRRGSEQKSQVLMNRCSSASGFEHSECLDSLRFYLHQVKLAKKF